MTVKLVQAQLDALAEINTPTICNAIESFNIRLRNEGYIGGSIINRLPKSRPMVGYAITVKMRTDKPPVKGFSYPDRNDWWDIIAAAPNPKIIVIEDTDHSVGVGSVAGGLHGVIFKTLGCIGIVTNGAVRDLDALDAMHMHVYSGSVVPSHAYSHIVDIGMPVEIGSMLIENGELLHGDQHGITRIPPDIAPDIHAAALKILNQEQRITQFCASPEFSVPKLREIVAAWYSESSDSGG